MTLNSKFSALIYELIVSNSSTSWWPNLPEPNRANSRKENVLCHVSNLLTKFCAHSSSPFVPTLPLSQLAVRHSQGSRNPHTPPHRHPLFSYSLPSALGADLISILNCRNVLGAFHSLLSQLNRYKFGIALWYVNLPYLRGCQILLEFFREAQRSDSYICN